MFARLGILVIGLFLGVSEPQPIWLTATDELRSIWDSASQLIESTTRYIEKTLSGFSEESRCPQEHSATSEKDSWKVSLVDKNEPGEPLIVSGTVYDQDGKTPLEGVSIYVYQTDAKGYYSKEGSGSSNPRIKGWMRTNAEGKYEFRTIKPASYPGRRIPAHIHCKVSGAGYSDQFIDEFLFEGDPYLTKDDFQKFGNKGRFSSIMKVTRDKDGVLRCDRDIKLSKVNNSRK